MNLLDLYQNYYSNPHENTAQELFQGITSYDFHDFDHFSREIIKIRQSWTKGKDYSSFLKTTSGSTGDKRQYLFGPLPELWDDFIEHAIKDPEYRGLIQMVSTLEPNGEFWHQKAHWLYEHKIFGDFSNIKPILEVLDSYPQAVISSPPRTFAYLFRHPEFIPKQLGFASTMSEPFYPPTYPVNDNMVDWLSGLNFFTCKHDTKHFLPTFGKVGKEIISLLNIHGKLEAHDDQFEIGERKTCLCGRSYLEVDYIPHLYVAIKNENGIFYKPSFANKLIGHYYSFQFVQQGDEIFVLHVGEMQEEDREKTSSLLKESGFSFRFLKNSYLVTGEDDKTAAFYNNWQNKKIKQCFKLHL